MCKKKLSFIIIFFCLFLYLFSVENYDDLFSDLSSDVIEESSSENSLIYDLPQFKLSFSGEHSLDFHVPLIEEHFNWDTYYKTPKFKNLLGFEINYKILKVVSLWQLDIIMNSSGDWQEVLEFAPDENYISLSPWKFNIKAGFQKFSWGTADGINPTDNINPYDLRGGFDSEKIPALSLDVEFYPLDWFAIEAVYLPFPLSNRLTINVVEEVDDKFGKFGTDVKEKKLDYDPKSFILGGKAGFFFRYVDFSFSYLYDIDSAYTPDFSLKKYGAFYVPEEIELAYKRVHYFGADFKALAGIFGIWGEICYSLTEDYILDKYGIRNHLLRWCTGFDFNYGPDDDFYFNCQYTGDFIPDFDTEFYKDYEDGNPELNEDKSYYLVFYQRSIVNQLGGSYQGLTQGIVLNVSWSFLDDLLKYEIKTAYFLPLIYDYNHEKRCSTC